MASSPALTSERIDVEDSFEEINDLFYQRGWTDGLPIVPPTEDRVARMLAGCQGRPDEVIGLIPPKWGEATLEKLAINAVMAGCRPDHLPVIVAAVEAVLAEEFNLNGIQATTHPVAPLVVVNGPIAGRLEINGGPNCFGQGWRANATIGRAIRLILTNVGGALPGATDRSTQGQPSKYSYCIAENEAANPWEPFHVERGFQPDESTVSVFGVENPHNINDHVSTTAEGILMTAADTLASMGMNNAYLGKGELLFVFGPEHAATIARYNWTKRDVKAYLFENARIPLGRARLGGMWGMDDWPIWVQGLRDDHALVPMVEKVDDILVMVAGAAGKHSCGMPSFGATRSVTRPITRMVEA